MRDECSLWHEVMERKWEGMAELHWQPLGFPEIDVNYNRTVNNYAVEVSDGVTSVRIILKDLHALEDLRDALNVYVDRGERRARAGELRDRKIT